MTLIVRRSSGTDEDQRDFTRWLLAHGADPNSGHLMADSTSAITAAAERGSVDLAELLVEHGAEVSGTGALPAAAGKGHLEMVRYLLDQGANLDEIGVHDYGDRRWKSHEGTALHKAAAGGHLEILELLLDRGARVDLVDPMDRTPLARAKEENQQQAVERLILRGVNG